MYSFWLMIMCSRDVWLYNIESSVIYLNYQMTNMCTLGRYINHKETVCAIMNLLLLLYIWSTVKHWLHLACCSLPLPPSLWGTLTDPSLLFHAAWQPGRSWPTVMVTIQHFVFVRSTSSLSLPSNDCVQNWNRPFLLLYLPRSPPHLPPAAATTSSTLSPVCFLKGEIQILSASLSVHLIRSHFHNFFFSFQGPHFCTVGNTLTGSHRHKLHPAFCVQTRALC